MKRRTFIKNTGAVGLFTFITPSGLLHQLKQPVVNSLEEDFLHPPVSAQPHTWWHWMNGHVTKEGITLDLEAMKKVGIGGFQNFFVGSGIPKGPVEYLSEEWLNLMKHTIAEADRLGLEFQMHNCPGWSSTGGPWITPELSMQQVVWSETFVEGGKEVKTALPQPFKRLNYYRDTFVLAFPSLEGEKSAWYKTLTQITSNNNKVDLNALIQGQGSGIEIQPANENQPGTLLLEFSTPFEAQSLLLYGTAVTEPSGGGILSIAPVTLEASDDGATFRKLFDITQIGGETPGSGSFPTIKAKYFRLLFPKPSRVYQVSLSGSARIADWTTKANYAGPPPGMIMTEASITGEISAGSIIDPASVLNISQYMDANGILTWKAPAGNWTILRIGHTTTARINKAAPTTGEGLECDKFSKEAYDFHFHKMFDNLLPFLKPLGAKGKVGVLIDSYEVGMQNWTKTFPEDFRKSRGYDIVKYLPAMTGRVVGSVDATERFLWDLRRVQSDLMANNYYGRCTELCKQHGFTSYTEPYNGGPLEQMQMGSRMDVNMGEFWVRTLHFRHSLKLASSIQHVYGKKVVGAESFTGHALFSKWQEYPYALKATGDYMYTKGLNRIIFHRYAHQPHPSALPGMTMGPWGMHFERTNTWWNPGRAWLTYLARCQYLLQQGLFVADLLYYTSEDAPGEDISLRAAPTPAPPRGYDYDNINTEALLNRTRVENNHIVLPDGMSYKILVLPQRNTMSMEVLRKLHQLVNSGMYLIGAKPEKVAGLSGYPNSDAEMRRLSEELWGTIDGKTNTERGFGKGKVFVASSLQTVLDKLNIQPDFVFTSRSSDPAINYIHRRIDNAEVYFVSNLKRRSEDLVCSFRVEDKRPEFWNADTGEIIPVDIYEPLNGRTQVPVRLDPAGSVFVVFRSKNTTKRMTSITKDNTSIISTKAFPSQKAGRYPNITNSFTMSAWVKPECDIALPGDVVNAQMLQRFGPKSFVFYSVAGDTLYGEGHAIAGLVAGRNGIAAYERTTNTMNAVLVVNTPLSGWTHLVLVYREGVPLVYINGKLVGEGKPSTHKVHPAIEEEYFDESAPYFEGDKSQPQLFPEALAPERIQVLAATAVKMEELPAVQLADKSKRGLLVWQNGSYSLKDNSGKNTAIKVEGIGKPIDLSTSWQVTFPPDLGAPEKIMLPQLMSLHKHTQEGVKYFSGTASYSKQFTLPADAKSLGKRLFLDLGQVEVMAEVVVNGKNLGILWKPPFRIDVTDAIITGNNRLEIQVTNLWPNRLIGDEQQPAEYEYDSIAFNQRGGIHEIPDWYVQGKPKPKSGRVTFTTWKHYTKESPLLESGLVGPVMLRTAMLLQKSV